MRQFVRAFLFLSMVLFGATVGHAQFRSQADQPQPPLNTADAMKGSDSFLSSIFDPARFSMHQSYSMSYLGGVGGGTGLSMFTNTFSYRASDNLFISADVSAVYSPFSSFGTAYQNSLNGIYLTNARLDWKLGDNTMLRIEYVGGPTAGMYGYGAFNPYYNPFYTPVPVPSQAPAQPKPTVLGQ